MNEADIELLQLWAGSVLLGQNSAQCKRRPKSAAVPVEK